jgi:hypothetical protein
MSCNVRGKVYENQTDFYLEASLVDQDGTAVNLTDATVIAKYVKPGATGTWPVTVTNLLGGVVRWVPVDEDDLSPSGRYRVWFEATLPSGRSAPTEPYIFDVYKRGQ